MKRLPLLLLSLAFVTRLGATAQAPDVLKIGGKTHEIFTNPLTPYLVAHPDRKLPEAEVMSTGLWRGYIATWEIRDGHLFLQDVGIPTKFYGEDVPDSKRFRSAMKPLFGDGTPRKATWFTGHLIVPTGEMVEYVHMGYGSSFASYLVITIVEGAVQQQKELDTAAYDAFRRAQYAAYKKTDDYAKTRASVTRGETNPDEALTEDFLYQALVMDYMSRIFEGVQP